ncbi:MAG: peptidyl-prolyl cis-trans isomerase [Candidatus Omnitrophica bacterium]|nr:peptidyl-prolyl cis-trans isomerase [Candidatus Omnitrophota bacterium]
MNTPSSPMSVKDPGKKLYLIILTIIISASLLYYGMIFYKKLFPSCVAGTINDAKVSCEDFDQAYNRHIIASHMQYGQLFEQFKPLLRLKEQTWEKISLLKEAKKQGIKIKNQQIIDNIASYDIFFANGTFNKIYYKQFVHSLDAKIPDFEESIRDTLILKALFDKVTRDIMVSDNEIMDEFQKTNKSAQLFYINIPVKESPVPAKVDEASLKNYFQQHVKNFDLPSTVKLEYVVLDFPADGGIQKQVEMKYKGKAIMDEYNKSKNLTSAAQQLKFQTKMTDYIDLSETGTDMPEWPLPLINDILQMKTGAILDPYEIKDKGYVIVRLLDRKPPHMPSFEEVKTKVAKAYQKNQDKQTALVQAQTLFDKFKAITTVEQFKQIAKDLGYEVKDSGELPIQQAIMTLDVDQNAQDKLVKIAQAGTVIDPVLSINGAAIIFVNALKPADMTKFEKSKKEMQDTVLNFKKEKIFEEFKNKLMKENVVRY